MDLELAARSVRATFESTFALFAAIALTLVLTLPFVPLVHQIAVPLIADPAASDTGAATSRIVEDLEQAGIAGSISVQLLDGRDQLVLEGVKDVAGATPAIAQALERAGYLASTPEMRPTPSIERLFEQEPRSLLVLLTIQSAVFLFAGWLLARHLVGQATLVVRAGRGRAALVGLVGGGVALAASELIAALLDLVGLPVMEQDWVQEILARPDLLRPLVPWMVLVGPIAEEVFFRGYVYRRLRAEAGLPTGVVVSSALFALTHFNASGFLVYLTIGVALALAYEYSGRLLTPVVGHIAVNLGALAAALLAPQSPWSG